MIVSRGHYNQCKNYGNAFYLFVSLFYCCFPYSEKSEDSCSSTPKSKNEILPAGCVLNGTNTTTVDVGECEPVGCVKGNSSFNSSCTDKSQCCGPRSFETALIQCESLMSFDLSVVKTCGCGDCIEKQTVIEGTAVGQDGSAAMFVKLFLAEKRVAMTDENGDFSFAVPKNTRRSVVTFKDQIIKKFEEEDKIFVLTEGQKVKFRVKLREKPKPITFNASEPLDVSLGGESDSFADLELPENALLTEDGSVFSGNAKASVSVTDPRNQSDISSAPGDFSTMNEDGEEEILETYGMMKLSLEDDNGKPLVMSKPMKVYLDPEKLNLTVSDGNVSIKLYWLDRKTGRWRSVGDFALEDGSERRRKRSNHRVFLTGTVTPAIAKANLNFDKPNERVGLRVAVNSTDSDGVIITAIRKDHKGYVERITKNGVVCMPIWRGEEFYLQAEKNFKYYVPDPSLKPFKETFQHVKGGVKDFISKDTNISSFEFSSSLVSPRGPIYKDDGQGGNERSMCENPAQSQEKGRQFVFIPPASPPAEYQLLDITVKKTDWNRLTASGYFDSCYIKVNMTGKKVLFMAVSYNKDVSNDPNSRQASKKGLHIRMARNSAAKPGNAVCLQFMCPRRGGSHSDHTVLLLTPMKSALTATCTFVRITEGALRGVQPRNLPAAMGNEKWIFIPSNRDDDKYSTYRGSGTTGEARCLKGDPSYNGVDTSEVNPLGASVEYDCR